MTALEESDQERGRILITPISNSRRGAAAQGVNEVIAVLLVVCTKRRHQERQFLRSFPGCMALNGLQLLHDCRALGRREVDKALRVAIRHEFGNDV